MSSNRLLNGIKDHLRTINTLTDINDREHLTFEGRLKVPNQAFDCLIKKDNEPQSIIFTKHATNALDRLRSNAKKQSNYRKSHNLKDKRIEFLCLGYIDPVGDIIITDIVTPIEIIYKNMITSNQKISSTEATSRIFGNSISAIKIKNIMEEKFKNHIMSKDPNDYSLVSLRGFTSPQVEGDGEDNCIKLKDLTDSIVPGNLKPQENIVTGVINLTPPTDKNPNGNIECAIIPHRTNANGTTTPTKIYNVINAQEEREVGKYSATLTPSPISQSNQPLTGLKPQKYLSIDDMQA